MKYCPNCQSTYADESLRFCLQDGTVLADGNTGNQPTQILSEQETVLSRIPVTSDREPGRFSLASQPEAKRSNSLLIVVLTAVGMCILFGGIAATWLMISNDDSKNRVAELNSNYPTPMVLPTKVNTNSELDDETGWESVDINASLTGDRLTYYRGTTAKNCREDCEVNSKCRGYGLVRAGFYNPNDAPMCYLLSKVTGSTPSPCCISGIKKER